MCLWRAEWTEEDMEVNTGGRGEMKGEREREKEEMQKSLNGGSGREGGGMGSNVVRREGRGGGRVCVWW